MEAPSFGSSSFFSRAFQLYLVLHRATSLLPSDFLTAANTVRRAKGSPTTPFASHNSPSALQCAMSTAPASRALLRQSRFLLRRQNVRQASTAAETANKAKETASETASKAKDATSNITSKASEGLSRVTSSGGSALSKAGSTARNALSSVGGRTGRVISLVECEHKINTARSCCSNEIAANKLNSPHTPNHLLFTRRTGALKTCLPRTEDDTAVSASSLRASS